MNTKKIFIITVLSVFTLFFMGQTSVQATATNSMYGNAWSGNIGWISFNNCISASSCSGVGYGVNMDTTTTNTDPTDVIKGDLSGYAWSDNIGWISFNRNDLSGCPFVSVSHPRRFPNIDPTTGAFHGCARAVASGNGWDGFIDLSGVTLTLSGPNTGSMTGYAWGSDVIGWIDMSGVAYGSPVVITMSPPVVLSGNATSATVSWTSVGATSCEATYPTNGGGGTNTWTTKTTTSGSELVSPTNDTTYAIRCSNDNGRFAVANTSVSFDNVGLRFTANPSAIMSGGSSTLAWSGPNLHDCHPTDPSGSVWASSTIGTSGTQSVSPSSTTTYGISCQTGDQSDLTASVTVSVTPALIYISQADSVSEPAVVPGDTDITSFTITGTNFDPSENNKHIYISIGSYDALPGGGYYQGLHNGITDPSYKLYYNANHTSEVVKESVAPYRYIITAFDNPLYAIVHLNSHILKGSSPNNCPTGGCSVSITAVAGVPGSTPISNVATTSFKINPPSVPVCTSPQVLIPSTNTCATPLMCTAPKILVPETNTCENKLSCDADGANLVWVPQTNTCENKKSCISPAVLVPGTNQCEVPSVCTAPQILVPETNTCQNKVITCTSSQVWVPQTNSCKTTPTCLVGQILVPQTKICETPTTCSLPEKLATQTNRCVLPPNACLTTQTLDIKTQTCVDKTPIIKPKPKYIER